VHCSTRFHLRLTPDQKSRLAAQASQVNCSAADYLRELIETGKVQPVLSINLHQWHRLAGLVSNLNQLVRHCNRGTVPQDLLPTLESVRLEVFAIRHDLLTKQEARK